MIIEDRELGKIRLVANGRAHRIIVRKKDGYLHLTHPVSAGLPFIKNIIEEMRPRLIFLMDKTENKIRFSPQTEFNTYSFSLKILKGVSTSNYYMRLKDRMLYISCPSGANFDRPEVQDIILALLEKALRYEANRLLPDKVFSLAKAHGFTVSGVKINKSRSRWGSCSSKKSINLSYYCMLLPEHLIEHVILHELCHTQEMNHSERFWQLLDKVSDGKSKEYTKALKSFRTAI